MKLGFGLCKFAGPKKKRILSPFPSPALAGDRKEKVKKGLAFWQKVEVSNRHVTVLVVVIV